MRLRYVWAEFLPNAPLLDLLSFHRQIFQGPVPDLSSLFTDRTQSSECMLVIPHEARHWTPDYHSYVTTLSRHYKVVYFNRGDFPPRINLNNAVEISTSREVGSKKKTVIVPYNVHDLGFLPLRHYCSRFTISFVGYLPRVSFNRVKPRHKSSVLHPIKNSGVLMRRIGLEALRRSAKNGAFDFSFATREHYGGAASLLLETDRFREEFINSIEKSDFVFSPRGDANASQRFYEAISAGRTTIVPNSNMFFPKISSRSLDELIVNVGTLSLNARSRVSQFWEKMEGKSYIDLQNTLKSVYKTELEYGVFMNKLFSKGNFDFHLQ